MGRAGKAEYVNPLMKFDLSGVPEVHAVLKDLGATYGDNIESKLARAAIGAGLTRMARILRRAAPKQMKKAIGTRHQKKRGNGVHGAKAGINVGKKAGRAPHAHFFVLGTEKRWNSRGAFRGRVRANFFVSRAIRDGGDTVVAAMLTRIQKRLPIELDRLRRKHGKSKPVDYEAVLRGL